MQTITPKLLATILNQEQNVYSVPDVFEIKINLKDDQTLRLIQIIEKPETIELVDINYNHHVSTWDTEYEISIIKRVEYFIGV